MFHTAHTVLSSGHTAISGFAFRPCHHPSTKTTSSSAISLGFFMEQPPSLSSLKLKQCHQPHLVCQASQDAVSLRLVCFCYSFFRLSSFAEVKFLHFY